MRSTQRLVTYGLLAVVLFITPPSPSNASLLGWLGVGEIGKESAQEVAQAIDRAIRSLKFLQDEFDADTEKYLREIDRISEARLAEFLEGLGSETDKISEITENTLLQIAAIERRAFYDARELIRDVECLVPVFSQQIKETLGDALVILSGAKAELRIPIIGKAGEARIVAQEINIQSPDQAYEDVKEGYLAALSQLGEGGSALSVLASYGNISRVARITSCHYRGLTLSKYYFAEVAYFEGLSAPWAVVTGLDQF